MCRTFLDKETEEKVVFLREKERLVLLNYFDANMLQVRLRICRHAA